MSAGTDAAALAAYADVAHVIVLRDAGWQLWPIRDDTGAITRLDGARTWPDGWADGIRIRSSTDALGIRTHRDGPADDPVITWEQTGALGEITYALLTLPAPTARLAPRLAVGAAPRLWTPHVDR